MFSCASDVEHIAHSINEEDSLPFMHSCGINTLISDSGVMRYHMVAEEWDIYDTEGKQSTWKFMKGMLMERFDEEFHIDMFVQADTAYLHEQKVWELRGRVVIRNIKGDLFKTEELFWDMEKHEMWSHKFMHITTPERELQGTEFRSNEEMTKYSVANSVGSFPVSDTENEEESADTITIDEIQPAATDEHATKPAEEIAPVPKAKIGNRFPPAPGKLNPQ